MRSLDFNSFSSPLFPKLFFGSLVYVLSPSFSQQKKTSFAIKFVVENFVSNMTFEDPSQITIVAGESFTLKVQFVL